MAETRSTSTANLIFIPAVITLAITILRLTGERQHWSHTLFNPEAGGGFALIGISWLPIIFGIYFAVKLAGAGERPASVARTIIIPIVGFAIIVATLALTGKFLAGHPLRQFAVFFAACVVAGGIQYIAWPKMFRVLLAYALAARIPVAIIMWFAIQGDWKTHYDAPPPDFPVGMAATPKFLWIGLGPQMTLWIAFTIIVGLLFGGIAVAVAKRKPTPQVA